MMDRRGRVLARITAEVKVSVERVPDLDGDGHPEALIETWSGGAHASFAYYLVSLRPKPYCILAYAKNNGEGVWQGWKGYPGDLEPRDLDGDGRPELVSWFDGFAYRLGAGYAPVEVPLVLRLSHGRYVEATTEFPRYVRSRARAAWYRFEGDLRERVAEKDPNSLGLATRTRAEAVGFLAPKIILGEEDAAWRLLQRRMAPHEYADLHRRHAWLRAVVAARVRSVRHPRLSELPLPWSDVYDPKGPWDG